MPLKSRYWRLRFARWPRRSRAIDRDGYTVLVPVPGDLPVFLALALGTIREQTAKHRVATYVIADQPSAEVTAIVERARRDWPGELRELRIGQPEKTLLPKLGDPGRNHGVQIITGLYETASAYTVLHDADLFLLHPDIHDRQYESAVERDLDVIGVSPSWDPWYAEHGRELAATWEMCARTSWFRRFPPWRVISHEDVVWGENHMFDTTFFAQTQTTAEKIAVQDVPEIVHFNYVISTYRKFVWHLDAGKTGFVDDSFRLLLIRFIAALFADEHHAPDRLPSFADLALGLAPAAGAPVVYPADRAETYLHFRGQAEKVLRGPGAVGRIAEARAGLLPFDEAYGWTAEREPVPSSG